MSDLVVSHSRIKTWRRCKMAHHYKYVQKLRPLRKSVTLYTGTVIHSYLEGWIERGTWKGEQAAVEKEFYGLYREEQEELGDVPTFCDEIMKGYVSAYKNDGLIYPEYEGRKTEIEVLVDFMPGVVFKGYIDAYPMDKMGDSWVLDHKTCRYIPGEDMRNLDSQLATYCWLAPRAGLPKPHGIVWDYIRTKLPSKPRLLKSGKMSTAAIETTPQVYKAELKRYNIDPKPYKDFIASLRRHEGAFFRRVWVPQPNQTFVKTLIRDLKRSTKEIMRYGEKSCIRSMGFGCLSCEYKSLCTVEMRGIDSTMVRESQFTTEEFQK